MKYSKVQLAKAEGFCTISTLKSEVASPVSAKQLARERSKRTVEEKAIAWQESWVTALPKFTSLSVSKAPPKVEVPITPKKCPKEAEKISTTESPPAN